jgi:hypothetical protein
MILKIQNHEEVEGACSHRLCRRGTVGIILLITTFFIFSCTHHVITELRPSTKASAFFKDYVANDGPRSDTLPVFMEGCRGNHQALVQIFSDYRRFGSGDNEAWLDVPDIILSEMGDQKFAAFLLEQKLPLQISAVKYLGEPALSLFQDSPMATRYPITAQIQKEVFAANPNAQP